MGFISAVLVCWFTDCSENKMYENPNDDLAGRISNCFTNFQMFITVTFSSKDSSQTPPFSMPSKLLILHGEKKSYCFTLSCVPESVS